ncbi:MAG: T9SS type A sorting domain-containing protein [Candidatus Cloacimonadales bacterium]
MKKFIIILLIFLAYTFLIGQETHTVDFEPDGIGADWEWTVTENSDNPPLEFIANPVSGGINSSDTVAKFTARQTGQPWALCFTEDDGEFTFDQNNSTVSIMVYKSVISNIAVKFEGMSTPVEISIANTLVDQWEEISYDFSAVIGNTYSKLIIIPDFNMDGRDQDNLIYLDNLQVPDGTVSQPPAAPTVGAPAPTHESEDVFAIYSDAYENLEGVNFNPSWGQSTVVTVDDDIAGNNTLKYENLNYQGTEFPNQDLSEYDYFHLDFWTPNSSSLDFYLISPGAELNYTLTITEENWVSVDIPLSHFSAVVDLTNLIQFKVVGNGTVWFDNWYFWQTENMPDSDATLNDLQIDGTTVAGFDPAILDYDLLLPTATEEVPIVTATTNSAAASLIINEATELPGTTSVVVTAEDNSSLTYNVNFSLEPAEPTVGAPIPQPEAANVISIYSDTYSNIEGTDFNPGWGQSTVVTVDEEIGGNNTLKYDNFNYQGTQFAGNQDLSLMEFVHIDLWTADATVIKFTPISASSGEHLLYLEPIAAESWNSFDIPLSDFEGVAMSDIHQLKFDGQEGVSPSTIYLDNIYFYKLPSASDATLSDLQVDGVTIAGFSANILNYTIELPNDATEIPVVTATANDEDATLQINDATELPGTTSVLVTAADELETLTYNVHFSLAPAVPEIAAATPTWPAADVISLFSNAYENVEVDTWSADWDQADLEDIQIAGNDTKLYTNLVYAGIEFTSATIDASEMTHFHLDIWTPDNTADPAIFKVKLVDFGADGAWGGEDDVEHELTFDETTLASESWINLHIPLSDFTNLTTRGHLAQLIISGDPNTVYIDNVYFLAEESENNPPHIIAEIADLSLDEDFATPVELELYDYFADIDGDELTFSFSQTTEDVVEISLDEALLTIASLPDIFGSTSVTITADDGSTRSRESISQTFEVTVNPINDAPVIVSYSPESLEISLDEASELSFEVVASDIDSEVDFSWYLNAEDLVNNSGSILLDFALEGEHEVKCIVSDEEYQVEQIWTVTLDLTFAEDNILPPMSGLINNFPNPFNPSTTIHYALAETAKVKIRIFNSRGQLVTTLDEGTKAPARYHRSWDAEQMPSGIYYYTLYVNQKVVQTKRMVLIK